jgi:hypothetical protein
MRNRRDLRETQVMSFAEVDALGNDGGLWRRATSRLQQHAMTVGGADGVALVSHEVASSTLGIVADQAARLDFDVLTASESGASLLPTIACARRSSLSCGGVHLFLSFIELNSFANA